MGRRIGPSDSVKPQAANSKRFRHKPKTSALRTLPAMSARRLAKAATNNGIWIAKYEVQALLTQAWLWGRLLSAIKRRCVEGGCLCPRACRPGPSWRSLALRYLRPPSPPSASWSPRQTCSKPLMIRIPVVQLTAGSPCMTSRLAVHTHCRFDKDKREAFLRENHEEAEKW